MGSQLLLTRIICPVFDSGIGFREWRGGAGRFPPAASLVACPDQAG
jgi:hypothetical protein